jgi:multidrug transporter EmrE-like cation transporter
MAAKQVICQGCQVLELHMSVAFTLGYGVGTVKFCVIGTRASSASCITWCILIMAGELEVFWFGCNQERTSSRF